MTCLSVLIFSEDGVHVDNGWVLPTLSFPACAAQSQELLTGLPSKLGKDAQLEGYSEEDTFWILEFAQQKNVLQQELHGLKMQKDPPPCFLSLSPSLFLFFSSFFPFFT